MTEQLVPEKEKKLKWWQVLWGVIRHPGSTFRKTGGRAGLGLPAFLMIGGTVFLTVATTLSQQGKLAAEMHKKLAETPNVPPKQIERIVAISSSPAAAAAGPLLRATTRSLEVQVDYQWPMRISLSPHYQ